jgi:hypothetical protein
MGQSNWLWPRILAHFVHENKHFGGFTNGEFSHQARDHPPPSAHLGWGPQGKGGGVGGGRSSQSGITEPTHRHPFLYSSR